MLIEFEEKAVVPEIGWVELSLYCLQFNHLFVAVRGRVQLEPGKGIMGTTLEDQNVFISPSLK